MKKLFKPFGIFRGAFYYTKKQLNEMRNLFMVFTKDSGLVKVWVGLVLNPDSNYTLDSVPALFNLKEVVTEVVASQVA